MKRNRSINSNIENELKKNRVNGDDESDSDESEDKENNNPQDDHSSVEDKSADAEDCVVLDERTTGTDIQKKAKQIESIFQKVKSSGNISTGGEAVNLPTIPGLHVIGFGDISVPLNEPQAKELLKICNKAPYGKNYDTITDKTVRDTYELDPSCVQLRHPQWETQMAILASKVVKDLGCASDVTYKLYKLLLYETGGHFKKHRDTEKENGMFATLIIQLPSIYTGGEFVVTHDGQSLTYDFGMQSGKAPYTCHYAAHYADVEHEILEIKSGYRLALVYSLCWTHGNRVCEPYKEIMKLTEEMGKILSNLDVTEPQTFALYLDHKYTPSALKQNGLQALKGLDADRASLLKNANNFLPNEKKLNFYIAHANLVIEYYGTEGYYPRRSWYEKDTGSDYDGDWEECERHEAIEKWYRENGESFMSGTSLGMKFLNNILNPNENNKKPWLKHFEEEFEGYTGNAGPNKTTTYHKYFLVFFPAHVEFDLLVKTSVFCGLDSVYGMLNTPSADRNQIKLNFQIFLKYFQRRHTNKQATALHHVATLEMLNSQHFYKILCIVEYLNDIAVAKQVFNEIIAKIECEQLLDEKSATKLAAILSLFSWDELKAGVQRLLSPIHYQIKHTCLIIQHLLRAKNSLDIDRSVDFAIVPIIAAPQDFQLSDVNEYVSYYTDSSKTKFDIPGLYVLADTLLLLQRHDLLNQLKDLIIEKAVPKFLKNFLDKINSEKKASFQNSQSILALYKHRLNWLKQRIAKPPVFTWSMKQAEFSRHPQVEDFFKSDKTQMIYNGFNGIKHARCFAEKYSGLQASSGYSASMTSSGIGKNANVQIFKTKDYFNAQVKQFDEYKAELPFIEHDIRIIENNQLI